MKYTENYNLKKPEGSDVVNIEDLNDNADIIDQALKAHDDALATKETPEGAQEKADAALNSAKQYTDQEVAEVAQELAAHKADIENRIDNPEYSSEQVVTGGIGNLPENLVEGQINDAIIEGLTAINLVKNGNFSNDTTNWYTDGANLSVSSNMINVKGNGSSKYCFLGQKISTSVAGKKYFLRAKVRVTNSQCTRIVLYGYSDNNIRADAKTLNSPVQNQEYSLYGIADFSNGTGAFSLLMYHEYADASTATDKIMEVKEVFVKELTGEDLALTADQINLKYLHWFDGTKSVLASLQIKTYGKNLFDLKNPSLLNDTTIDGSIITTNFNNSAFKLSKKIKLKPNTQYTAILFSNDISCFLRIFDGQGTDITINQLASVPLNGSYPNGYKLDFTTRENGEALITTVGYSARYGTFNYRIMVVEKDAEVTTFEEYKESIQYISAKDSQENILELRSLPNGTKDKIDITKGKLVKKISNKITLQSSDFVGIDTFSNVDAVYTKSFDNMIFLQTSTTGIISVEGKDEVPYADKNNIEHIGKFYHQFNQQRVYLIVAKGTTLAQAREQLAGTTIIYQLAAPQEIPVSVDGTLQAFEDGSIYIEPYLKEEFVVTGTSINLPIPISAIDKIEILQNNVWTEATGTLSSDGKTITVSTSGKYRVFGSIKSEESLIPEVTYTVPVNLKAQVDSNTKAITAINKRMIDLNDKVDILSVEFNELNSAKQYTDQKVGEVTNELTSHKNDNTRHISPNMPATAITFGGKFQIAYNSTTNSLDITVVS